MPGEAHIRKPAASAEACVFEALVEMSRAAQRKAPFEVTQSTVTSKGVIVVNDES